MTVTARKMKRDLTVEEQLARGPMDLPFLMLTLMLTGIGLVMVFSASYATAYYDGVVAKHDPTYYFARQALFGVIGIVFLYGVSRLNYQHYRWLAVFALMFAFLCLILVFTPLGFGKATTGAQRWIRVPGLGSFQPSEAAKLGVILYFSSRLSKRSTEKRKKYDLRKPSGRLLDLLDRIGFIELVPYMLILGAVALLMLMEPHMSGTIQSLYAIGSGGLLGVGLGSSRQKFNYLPEPENDYVFSITCEELGYIGAAIIIILFALLVIRGYWIALHARDRFGALLVVGITTLTAVQVFLNIAVVTNLIPPTGISLPFFSYGGTALMIQLVEMGIVLSVSRQIPAPRQG